MLALVMPSDGSALSLYRKWRPQRFSEVVGQTHVVATLRRAVELGKLHHAYLLAGQRGIGKTTLARILARAANCQAPQQGEPCNRCPSCQRILKGQSLDVIEIDGASNRGIDQIRQLREEVAYVPAGSKYKVYIIDEVHMLTGEAFNALLKTLEEPPPHVLFIFATTEPHKVPATVMSRVQAFELHPIPEELIAQKLQEVAQAEGVELEPAAAQLIARRAQGALRDALVVLEQLGQNRTVTEQAVVELLGLFPLALVDRFLDALRSKDADQALEVVAEIAARGRDLALFLEEGITRARDRIIAGEGDLVPIARKLLELRSEIGRVFSRRVHVELAIVELCGQPKVRPPSLHLNAQPAPVRKEPSSPDLEPAGQPDASSSLPEPPGECKDPWGALLEALVEERPDVAAFLLPAQAQWADGLLTVRLPPGYRYHYESLREPEAQGVLEEKARKFYEPLLAVQVLYEGANGPGLSLEEAARLLAEALEGTIVKENESGKV